MKEYCCDNFERLIKENFVGKGHDGPHRVTFNYLMEYLTVYISHCPFCGSKLENENLV
ncbi:MAG: hypothetical protein ACRD97_05885 [Nitrososphaeraceae archaeon]|jgi:hypothetical protein